MVKAVAGRLALSRDSCQKACVKSVLENQQEPAKAEIKDSMVGGSVQRSSVLALTALRSLTSLHLSLALEDFGSFLGTKKAGELKGLHEWPMISLSSMD